MANPTRPQPIKIEGVKILDVTFAFDSNGSAIENQIKVTIDKELDKINPETGEKSKSNTFTKKHKELTNQLAKLDKRIKLVNLLGMGKKINPALLALTLCDAVVTIEGSYHFKDEKRNFEGATDADKYTSDCWVYEITAISKEWTDEENEAFAMVRATEPYIQTKQETTKSTLPSWYK